MRTKTPIFFLIPALSLICLIVVYPILDTIYLSFLTPEGEFAGLENYAKVLNSKEMLDPSRFPKTYPPWGILIHNAVWIALHLPLSLLLGLVLAVALREVRGSSIVKSMIFIGMVTPMVVGGWMVRFMFDKDIGIVNLLLRALGLMWLADKTWTAWPELSLLATILGSVWMWTGFSMVIYSAALATIPKEYYEAAEIDGASALQKFFYITLPMLRPATLTIVVMTVLYELKIFDIVFVATRGGPGGSSNVLALEMYFRAFRYFRINEAAVIAVLLTLLTLIPAIYIVRTVVRR